MAEPALTLDACGPPSIDELIWDDGEPLESERHRLQMQLLLEALEIAWADRDDVWMGGNIFLYYSALQLKKNEFRGPDVMVVLDTVRRERKAWVIWEEDGRAPDLIIEILSDSTAAIDRGPKKQLYAQLGIPLYFLFDPFSGELEGYWLLGRHYRPLKRLPSGRWPARWLGLELGIWQGTYRRVTAPWLRWFSPAGDLLPCDEERAAAASTRAEQEAARADREAASRLITEQRLQLVEAELNRLRGLQASGLTTTGDGVDTGR